MKNRMMLKVMAIALIGAALSSSACQPDQLRKAAQASDTMAGAIKSLILAKRELAKQGKLTRDEELKVTQLLFALNEAVTVFNNQAKNSKTWDASVKTALAGLFADVTTALTQLNSQGILNIADPDAKQKLAGI